MLFSVRYEFHGDYVNIRRHTTWKNALRRNGLRKLDRHVVFADIINKVHMSNGKVFLFCNLQKRFKVILTFINLHCT